MPQPTDAERERLKRRIDEAERMADWSIALAATSMALNLIHLAIVTF